MTVRDRVRAARRRLFLAVAGSAVLWGAAAGLLAGALGANAVLGLAAGTLVAVFVAWRQRGVGSMARIALWVEEAQPALQYTLVTALDPQWRDGALPDELFAAAGGAEIEQIVARRSYRALFQAGLGLCAGLTAFVLLPAGGWLENPGRTGSAANDSAARRNRLSPLVVGVVPPRYSKLASTTVTEPSTIAALAGSRINLTGKGDAGGILLILAGDTVAAAPLGPQWAASLTMPGEPAVALLRDSLYRRLVVLEPQPDSSPQVILLHPIRDTIYRELPRTPLIIEARAEDDLGLVSGYVEYLLSTSGGGETYETVTTLGPRQDFDGARVATLRVAIRLDTMRLTPGGVLSIRVVALDANDVSGPGKGVSETRTLRLAEELDSTSVNPQPPEPIDEAWISQRLLNLKTDTLIRARGKLSQPDFADRSGGHGNTQDGIRERVLWVVSIIEDDGVGGSAPTTVSTLLRSAADEMMSARMLLAVAQPDSAMPHMRRALKILDQVRTANRYYLRGLMRRQLVDLEKVRLQGKEPGSPTGPSVRPPLPRTTRELADRIQRAADIYPTAPEAALDSLTFIRVAALRSHPAVSTALKLAAEQLRTGQPWGPALAPALRLLMDPARVVTGPPEWSGAVGP